MSPPLLPIGRLWRSIAKGYRAELYYRDEFSLARELLPSDCLPRFCAPSKHNEPTFRLVGEGGFRGSEGRRIMEGELNPGSGRAKLLFDPGTTRRLGESSQSSFPRIENLNWIRASEIFIASNETKRFEVVGSGLYATVKV